jgi:hypothetical protein
VNSALLTYSVSTCHARNRTERYVTAQYDTTDIIPGTGTTDVMPSRDVVGPCLENDAPETPQVRTVPYRRPLDQSLVGATTTRKRARLPSTVW